jgi:hypothetical protein
MEDAPTLWVARTLLLISTIFLKFYSLLNTFHTCTQLQKITFSPSCFCAQAISKLEDKKAPPPWKHKLTFENIFSARYTRIRPLTTLGYKFCRISDLIKGNFTFGTFFLTHPVGTKSRVIESLSLTFTAMG